MKKLWALAYLFLLLLAPVVMAQGVYHQQGETIRVELIWSNGFWSSTVRAITVDSEKNIYIGGGLFEMSPRLRVSTDGGRTWTPDSSYGEKFGVVFAITSVDSGYVLAGTDGGLFRSKDKGKSWQGIFLPKQLIGGTSRVISSLLVAKDKSIFAGGAFGIFRSTDNGNSWSAAVYDSTFIYPYVVVMTQTPSGVIIAGCGAGFRNEGFGVIRSTDNGRTWRRSNNGLPLRDGKRIGITGMASHPFGFSRAVYIMTDRDGAFVSYDEGINWESISPPVPKEFGGAAMACYPLGVFLGLWYPNGGSALHRSYGAAGWLPIPGINEVYSLVQYSPNQILVGTDDGLYRITFENPTPVEQLTSIPATFELRQNYPNPFNPSTTIEFSIPERSFVKLTIHNLLGQEIEALVSEEKEAGTYRTQWSAAKLPSGVYLYRLETPKFQMTKKMLLVK